jgi:transcriptional regulator with XRE-family HTH domain
MLESFGTRLRLRREQQEIDLIAIAEQTKIKLSLLEALERDDVSHWPAGIFRRAFVRAYAHAIGLNPDEIVREFLEVHPDPIEVVATTAAITSALEARGNAAPPTRLRHLVGSAIDSLSRLRRPPAAEEPMIPEPAPITRSAWSEGYGTDAPARGIPLDLPAKDPPPAIDEPPAAMPEPPAQPAPAVRADSPARDRADAPPPPAPTPVEITPIPAATTSAPDLLAAAQLCTELGRVEHSSEVQPLLQEASRILDAIGLIVWVWDPRTEELRPALASGYSDRVLAQLPTVRRAGDNATAAAFRMAETCAINGSARSSGALAVPLLTPAGCAGVLAIELQHGSEQAVPVRAIATIFAAQLAQLIGGARSQTDQIVSESGDVRDGSPSSGATPLADGARRQDSSPDSLQPAPSASAQTAVR